MTAPINSVGASPAYQPYVPTVSGTAAGALSSEAVSLSAQSAVVASLGGTSGASVYSPSGLLDALKQAGQTTGSISAPAEGSNVDTSNTAQQAQDLAVIASLGSSPAASGVYTGAGTVNGLSEQASANWADLLKVNPNLAGTVISYSFDAGLVSSLQVTA